MSSELRKHTNLHLMPRKMCGTREKNKPFFFALFKTFGRKVIQVMAIVWQISVFIWGKY